MWDIFKNIIFLIMGFILLIKGADFFVDGSSGVAKKLRVPPLIIGLTIVAMGTSLPELSVSVVASIENSNALSVSNAVGSNIFNLLVVLGITAVITRIDVFGDVIKRDFPISIVCAGLLAVVSLTGGELKRIWGIIFLVLFAIYIFIVVRAATKSRNSDAPTEGDKNRPIWLSVIFIAGGIVAIKFGGDWVVDNAVGIARIFGISETFIGLTIVSVGTSLPEMVTSIVAARKGEVDMAVGNVVGSNIFNILLILGTASAISPIAMTMENTIDVIFLTAVSIIGFIFCFTKKNLSRMEGIIMLLLYAGFLAYILIR